jgi:hypothetical protein
LVRDAFGLLPNELARCVRYEGSECSHLLFRWFLGT